MSQKLPQGYTLLRAKSAELFTYLREGSTQTAGEAFPSRRDAIDAIWSDFRARATRAAAQVSR
jgi:hypothetical protein